MLARLGVAGTLGAGARGPGCQEVRPKHAGGHRAVNGTDTPGVADAHGELMRMTNEMTAGGRAAVFAVRPPVCSGARPRWPLRPSPFPMRSDALGAIRVEERLVEGLILVRQGVRKSTAHPPHQGALGQSDSRGRR